jgi:nucleoside-diphosphate-sugar epimerase
VRDGHRVWGLRRGAGELPEGVLPLRADLLEPESLRGLPEDLEVLVYCASPGAPEESAYRDTYLSGLGNLLEVLGRRRRPLARLLFTSSTAVYGQSRGEWVDEDSPTRPARFSGRILLEAESLALGSGLPAVILRLGGIYGPGRTRLLDRVQSGRARCRPGPPRFTNRIHRDDAAGALRHLMALESPEPVYLGVDADPADECEVLRWMAVQLGVDPPPVEDRQSASAHRGAGSKRCSRARLLASGHRLLYPSFRDGYSALLRERAG